MSDVANEHHRHSLRLPGYDYSLAGAYFVTVCTLDRACLFGEIERGFMRLNEYGEFVAAEWLQSAALRSEIKCGEYVVMPNHFHGIVQITGGYGNTPDLYGDTQSRAYCHTPLRVDTPCDEEENGYGHMLDRANCHTPLRSPSRNLGAMVRGFKSAVSRRINEIRNTSGVTVWQRNYYEHVIRDEADYNGIVEYISCNPQRWMEDSLHPQGCMA